MRSPLSPRRLMLAALLGAAACLSGAPAARADDLTTEHYRLHVEGLDAADVGAMLEALHAQLKTYFGKAPREPLCVEVYATAERWGAALKAGGTHNTMNQFG